MALVLKSSSAEERVRLSEIDASTRPYAVYFLLCAVLWLLAGTALALIASIKLHAPEFLKNCEWLTFGRARAAHLTAVAYGWSNNAIFAVSFWIMARLCQRELMGGKLLLIAGIFWNVGVLVGIIALMSGQITSVEWLDMPRYVGPLLAVSYVLIGIWGVMSFLYRKAEHVYVSQWYILAAIFWFPWLYSVAQVMVLWFPARGAVQAVANWWFAHNVLGLWVTPMALSAIYYFIPKVLGKPIHSYYLSLLGFWSLALFYNWAGMHHLIGGPVPVWLISASTVASIMMVVPVLVTAINHHFTVIGSFKKVWKSPVLRFIVFGAMSYTLSSFIGSAMALREVNEITHFTHLTVGHAHHGLYAFFTMVAFGSIYFMLPRLLRREWPSALLIHLHFWCVAVGITLMVVALHVGGWLQGLEMNDPSIPFLDVVKHTQVWLKARTHSGILITVGHIAFAINFFWMLLFCKETEITAASPKALDTRAQIP